jgi:hypothetical protein
VYYPQSQAAKPSEQESEPKSIHPGFAPLQKKEEKENKVWPAQGRPNIITLKGWWIVVVESKSGFSCYVVRVALVRSSSGDRFS